MFKFLLLGLGFMLFGCASRNYYQSDKWKQNNTVTVKSENLNQFSIYIEGENIGTKQVDESNIVVTKYRKNNNPNDLKRLITVNSSSAFYNVTFDGFKKKDIKVSLLNENYEKIDLTIQKRVRYDALAKDIFCGVFTFGLPFLIDPFKSDFYKIKKNSVNHNVRFEYNQDYMKSEYAKIQHSIEVKDFSNWLSNYPRSVIYQKVVDQRDSLEFSYALKEQSEIAIDNFISSHNKSKYLESAISLKNEMKAAREMFELSKNTNSTDAYEAFLQKFPKSLHVIEARKLLVDAAERDALTSLNSSKIVNFIKNYLNPNETVLDENTISERRKKIRTNLENLIIQENIKNDHINKNENYSKLWHRYIEITSDSEIPNDIKSFEKIKNYQVEICNLLFITLQEAITFEKQSSWKEKSLIDFPKLELFNNTPSNPKDILHTVLNNQKNGNGQIKIFNSNYLMGLTQESKNDNGLISKFKSGNYEYREVTFNALSESNYQELNFKDGVFSGMSKAFKDNQLLFTFETNKKNEMSDEISYYKEGKLIKTINISKGFTSEGACVVNYSFEYEFENGVNLSLKYLDEKIRQGNEYLKNGDFTKSISIFEDSRKNNFPSSTPQNLQLDKCITNAKNKEADHLKKEEEKRIAKEEQERKEFLKKVADSQAKRAESEKKNKVVNNQSNNSIAIGMINFQELNGLITPQEADRLRREEEEYEMKSKQQSTQAKDDKDPSSSASPGIYKCGTGSAADYIRLNSNGTGKLYIDWIASEYLNFSWSTYGEEITITPILTEEQQYTIYNIPPMKYSIYDADEILTLYHGMSGTEFVFVKQ